MSNDEKTLVILTPGFAKDEADTTCIPMQQTLVRSLKEKYPHLHVVILTFQYPYEKKTYEWQGNVVISFGGRNKGGLSKLRLRRKVLEELGKLDAVKKIDGLLSFWYGECAWVGNKFSAKSGTPHFCWMWGQDAKKQNNYVGRVKLKANELITFSDFLQHEFEKNHGLRPLHVITPGIDTREFSPANVKKDIDIIAAGSLIPLKQYEIFVEVVTEIKRSVPSVKAVLIGDGPEKNKLQTLIQQAGMQDNITLTGELPHPEVLQWMQRGKIFLHPSSFEGFGVVCIEALYAGCDVISFVKPMDQQIENWHIVDSIEEMKQQVINLLKSANKTHHPVLPFSVADSVEALMDLFGQQPRR